MPCNDEGILPAVLIPFVALHCSDSQEVEDVQEMEDAELDEPNIKKDDLKLSPEAGGRARYLFVGIRGSIAYMRPLIL